MGEGAKQQWRGCSTRTARFSSPAHTTRQTAGGLESTRERRGSEELDTACLLVHANPERPVSPHS